MNSIQLVTKTITSSTGAKVTLNQLPSEATKVSLKPTEIMGLVSNTTQSVLTGDKAKTELESSIETFNKNALALHTGGVRLQDGRSKDKDTMVIRTQFMDETKTLAKNTAQKYYEWFMKVVNTGKPLKSFNDDSKSKKSKGANTEPQDINEIIAKLFNHAKFGKTFSVDTQLELKTILEKAGYEVAL
jgi:hypothetical protein